MLLLALFIAVPLIEIALFVQVGATLGLGWVLGSVLITALLGTFLVKQQGRSVLIRLRSALTELRDPSKDLADGAMILFSGALLLTPGYFTDAIGFLLLVPAVRAAVWARVRDRAVVQRGSSGAAPACNPVQKDVIDADFREVDSHPAPPSGWTKP